MTDWALIALGVVLTIGTALFVAAEFSYVALDPSHVDPKSRVGKALKRLSTQLSGAQVGITITTIALGYTAQPALTNLLGLSLESTTLSRAAVGVIAGTASLVLVNAFSMIIGELVPKNAALAHPMPTAKAVTPFMTGFTALLRPVISVLNGAANAILRTMGITAREELSGGRSRQELAALVRRSAEAGTLEPSTALLLKNTIELDELSAVDVMTDRTRLRTVESTETAGDVVTLARMTGHSRFPVVSGGPDDVVGIVHLRSAISVPFHERGSVPVTEIMAPAARIPETARMLPLLLELREVGHQSAVVIDEYGGTAGFVTLEDVIEELVGEVLDEHDPRRPPIRRTVEGGVVVPGDMRPDEIEEIADIAVPESPAYETLGGFVMATLGRVPAVGDVAEAGGVRAVVESMDGRRIEVVRLTQVEQEVGE